MDLRGSEGSGGSLTGSERAPRTAGESVDQGTSWHQRILTSLYTDDNVHALTWLCMTPGASMQCNVAENLRPHIDSLKFKVGSAVDRAAVSYICVL